MKYPVALPSVHENSEAKRNKFQAGVRASVRERVTPSDPKREVYFDQDFARLEAAWPVASGGIHVLNIPDLYAIYGNDAFWLFGSGTHGHPKAVAWEHASTGSPPKRLPPAKHSMKQPMPAPNRVRRWNCGARSSSE